ncbi:iron complex transport system ATP-binding protein [Apibacter mensalis]|uniref:Iron complex transport system ATP-binding protein n=1 Tax=Apibacter mensalis TaxID=1586267 RepID=A0A0X8XXV8_9FLAO|nr:ABC transporter ATP-binding protein [Apibacter mensalis]CVK15539.1 iron complex transport system ATP-binding protein [Apibacter mensalis]
MEKNSNPILEINNLSIGYQSPILSGINTTIKKGEIILLVGKNGSGKTTLLKSIYGEIPLLKGKIKIEGKNISEISPMEIGKHIAVVLSHNPINPSLRVFDLVALGRYPYKKWYQRLTKMEMDGINHILRILNLNQYREYYITNLSDGNLQKVMIARALVQNSPLLILDEPTSHLDINNKLEIMRIIKAYARDQGKSILLTSHDLALGLAISDQLWFIKDNFLHTGFTEDIAIKHNLFDYFTNDNVRFDYQANEYCFLNSHNHKIIQINNNSPAIYWLKKALIKNNFTISDQAPIQIVEKNSIFHLIDKNEIEYCFTSIEEVINFLNLEISSN